MFDSTTWASVRDLVRNCVGPIWEGLALIVAAVRALWSRKPGEPAAPVPPGAYLARAKHALDAKLRKRRAQRAARAKNPRPQTPPVSELAGARPAELEGVLKLTREGCAPLHHPRRRRAARRPASRAAELAPTIGSDACAEPAEARQGERWRARAIERLQLTFYRASASPDHSVRL